MLTHLHGSFKTTRETAQWDVASLGKPFGTIEFCSLSQQRNYIKIKEFMQVNLLNPKRSKINYGLKIDG